MNNNNTHISRNDHVTEVEPARFMAEAAELRWMPGHFPTELTTDLGNGQPFRLAEVSPLGDHRYTQEFGIVELWVFND